MLFCVSSFDPRKTFQFYIVSLYIIGAAEKENTWEQKQARYSVYHPSAWVLGASRELPRASAAGLVLGVQGEVRHLRYCLSPMGKVSLFWVAWAWGRVMGGV